MTESFTTTKVLSTETTTTSTTQRWIITTTEKSKADYNAYRQVSKPWLTNFLLDSNLIDHSKIKFRKVVFLYIHGKHEIFVDSTN